MKRDFTLLMAAFALMVCMIPQVVVGQTRDVQQLTNANIVSAGPGQDGYNLWEITDNNNNTWNAYAIKNKHSNATSTYHYLQIKKYASSTAYYVQVPELGTKITSIAMTVSGASQPMGDGGNTATLYFSNSNSTSATGTGVASGTGASSVTIDCSSLNLNTGFITASGAVRIWNVSVTYTNDSGGGSSGEDGTLTFDFEDPTAHRTSGSNNYTGTNTYNENGATISLTYADAVSSGSPLADDYHVVGRVAKNTTNSPVVLIGPINITNWNISKIEYLTKGVSAMSQVFATSTNGSTWTTQLNISSMPTQTTTETKNGLSITGTQLYLRWTVSVSSSTGSARDFNLDNIVITYTDSSEPVPVINATSPATLAYNATSGAINYTITNPVTGTSLVPTILTGGDWISNVDVTTSQVTFNVSTNTTNSDRTGSIKLSYQGAQDKTVTITQGHLDVAAPTFSPAGGNYSTAQTVNITAVSGATIYYTINGNNPTTSSTEYSSPIQVSEYSVIKAIAVKNGVSSPVATATYNIIPTINVDQPSFSLPYTASSGSFGFTITNPASGAVVTATTADDWITPSISGNTVNFQVTENTGNGRSGNITLSYVLNSTTLTSVAVSVNQEPNPNQPGGQNNPYTVAQAVAATPSSGSSDWVYVRGIVSEIIEIEVIQYHNARYYISDDGGTTSVQLQSYRGRNINNTDFLSEDELFVGDEVIVYGQLKKFNDAPELDADNYITSLYRAVQPVAFNPPSCVMTSGSYVSLFSSTFDEWDAEVYYTTDGSEPSKTNGTYFDVWGDLIGLTQTTTIKAVTYVPDLDKYSPVTQATYTIVSPEEPGWVDNPYSVSEALDALDQNSNIKGAYVHGIVSRIVQIETSQYFNATYYIKDENDPNDTLQVYRGKYISRGDFTSQDDLQIGDIVTVFGDLTVYNSTTKEFKPKNYIEHFYRPTSIIIGQHQIEVDCNATFGIINVTYSDDILVNVYHPTLRFCDAQGNAASYDWLTVTLSEDTNWDLEYEIDANSGDQARTAYMKVVYHDTDSNLEVVSNIVSITQNEFQVDYATLPFSFDGGVEDIASTVGLEGDKLNVKDYSSSPKLKFDKQDSSLVLKINEVPGVLTYDIQSHSANNSDTWTGTFKVQVSTDGNTWIDKVVYTSNLDGTVQSETISDLPVTTRYIRWIYTTKSGGNVGVGNIYLDEPILFYDIVLTQPQEGGTIDCDRETAAEGETVLLNANLSEGYVLADWDVLDADNNPIMVEGDGTAAYSFTMPASDVTVEAVIVPYNAEFHYAYSINGVEGQAQTATVGTMLTLAAGSDIVGQPFTFVGWSTNANNVENVMSAGASYKLTRDVTFYAVYVESVAGSSAVKQYVRVTEDLETNWAGDYLIAYSDAIFADGQIGGVSGLGEQYNNVSPGANLHDNAVEAVWGDTYRVTLEEIVAGSNTYLLKTQDGKYNYYTNNTHNGLAATDNRSLAANYPITVVFESANDIQLSLGGEAEGSVFRYNPDEYFRFYKNCGQQPVYLYKKTLNTANRYTRVFVDNPTGDIVIAGPSIVPNGSVLNVSSITNSLGADKLVVEEGAQLVTSSNVNATIKKFVNPYQGESDNYYLISSPVDGQNPAEADMMNGEFDLYFFNQSAQGQEWRNYEAGTFNLQTGKGYLYANNYGGYITISGPMVATADNVTIEHVLGKNFAGWNLIGNPYPCNVTIGNPYYRLAEGGSALAIEATSESVAIAPMEGVFVYTAAAEAEVTFIKAYDVSTTGTGRNTLSLRVSRNRATKDGPIVEDNAIVRFGEGSLLRKLVLNPDNAQLYVAQDGTDYAIVNAEAEGELPVSFRAAENGNYTISANADGVSFRYLHLIDNKTGADVDLLQTPTYRFEATTADYTSRFRLVFSANSDCEDADGDVFAFFNGSQWVVSNEGDATLQVVDVLGRVLSSQVINGDAEVCIHESQGIYLLRLLSGDSVKVQKIVIR